VERGDDRVLVEGRYRIDEVLGQRERQSVFRVFDFERQATLVLKSFSGLGARGSSRRRAFSEFARLAGVDFPSIVPVVDCGLDPRDGSFYFTSRFVEGREFIAGLQGQPFEDLLANLAHILRALDFLHRNGIVHGDLKPSNVLIEEAGGELVSQIIDFGLARSLHEMEKELNGGGLNRVSGTLLYMAPEVLEGEPAGVAADLYSLGLMIYQLLYGSFPFDISTPERSIQDRLNPKDPLLLKPPPGVTHAFLNILGKLLRNNPSQRYLTAREVLNDLGGVQTGGFPFVTKATLSGLVRSSYPELLDVETQKVLSGLGVPAKEGHPMIIFSSTGYAKLLGERVRFAAAAAGVHSHIVCGDARDLFGLEIREHSDAGFQVEVDYAPRGSLGYLMEHYELEPSEDSEGREGYVLLLQLNDHSLSQRHSREVMDGVRGLYSSKRRKLALFCSATTEEYRELWREQKQEGFVVVKVGQISRTQIATFLKSLFDWQHVPPALLDLLCPSTNAEFKSLREMLIYLVASEIIDFEMGEYRFHEGRLARASVDGLDRLMGFSFDTLSADEMDVAERLSIFPDGAPVDVIEELEEGGEARRHLMSLKDRGLVSFRLEGPWRSAAFESFALRSLIYDRLSPEKRQEYHLKAAWLLNRDAGRIKGMQEEIAIHLARSGDVVQSVPMLLQSAEKRIARGSFGRADSLVDEALCRENLVDSPLAFRVYFVKARILSYLGRVEEAINLFDRALVTAASTAARPEDLAAVLIDKAKAYVRTGEAQKAISCYEEILALDLGDDLTGMSMKAQAKSLRAYSLYRMHQSEEALEEIEEALGWMGPSDTVLRAATCNRLGTILFSLGRFDEAEVQYRESIRIFEKIGEPAQASGPYYNLGRILKAWGFKAEAVEFMKKAAELARRKEETYSVCTALTGISSTYLEMGHLSEARQYALRAMTVAKELGSKRNMAFLNGNLGEIALYEGDLERAEDFFNRCERIWRSLDDARSVSKVCLLRAQKSIRLGQLDDAEHWLISARELGGSSPAGPDAINMHRTEAEFLMASCRFEEAIDAVDEALRSVSEMQGSEMTLILRDFKANALVHLRRGAEALDEVNTIQALLREGTTDFIRAKVQITRCAAQRIAGRPDKRAVRDALRHLTADGLRDTLAEGYLELARTLRAVAIGENTFQNLDSAMQALGEAERLARSVRNTLLLRKIEDEKECCQISESTTPSEPDMIRRLSDMERLQEITRSINSEMDIKKLLALILDMALEMTGAVRGFIILVKGKKLEFTAARQLTEEDINDPEFEVSHSIAQDVALTGEPILTSNAQDDDRFRDAVSISELKLLSVLCVPLKTRKSILGSLYIDNPNLIDAFDEYDLKMMTAFANQAGIGLGNADLLEQNLRKQKELTRSKAEIERLNFELKNTVEDQAQELVVVKGSLEVKQRQLELTYRYDKIVTQSSKMLDVLRLLDRLTTTDFAVMILGESGTGKELVARSLHYNGPRRKRDFVSLNCAALVEPLVESELFGYTKGAFTGADRDKTGLFELADGGTLFLDEIGDMSLEVQKRLLRVLQSGEFMPVGGKDYIKVNVRIISATNRSIYSMVKEGTFREDLFYRLNVAVVKLPALRERKEDIPLLINHFEKTYSEQAHKEVKSFDAKALELMVQHEWRGNVRELENVVKNLVFLDTTGDMISQKEILSLLDMSDNEPPESLTLKEQLEEFEKSQIIKVLEQTRGNKTKAAKELGLSVRGLYKKLNKYGVL